MTNPTKTIFDFTTDELNQVEVCLEGFSVHWYKRPEWEKFSGKVLAEAEARLAKREPRAVSGECDGGWPWIKLDMLAINMPRESSIRYTITEVIPGAEPEPDWKAECERLTKRVNELVDCHQQDRKLIAERDDRIRDLEGSLAAASAAAQKLEKKMSRMRIIRSVNCDSKTTLTSHICGEMGAVEIDITSAGNYNIWLEKVSG